MPKPLTQTTLRIRDDLKAAAEDAAKVEFRSFSNWVCQAIIDRLARRTLILPDGDVHRFTLQLEFDVPASPDAVASTREALDRMAEIVDDIGGHNLMVSFNASLPPV